MRSFCANCGSVTPLVDSEMGLVLCPAGNLEGQLDSPEPVHVFVGSKAAWHSITDTLPQRREF